MTFHQEAYATLNGGFEDFEHIIASAVEPSLGRLPVDDLPDVFNVRRLAIQVLPTQDSVSNTAHGNQ